MMLDVIGKGVRPAAESFLLSASLHYLFKRQKNAALIGGGIAAGLTLIESMIYPTGEHDDECRVFYKAGLLLAVAVALSYFKQPKIHLVYSILPSLFFYQSNHYFVWLK
ncbi:MAG: hypothetical protein KDK44_01475 [Chlamydiia bacterium]|nr:hypothetical protein [Chlamydiia bacterium]MCP5509922.1 hypothetical protein [Chlamydiales bacterium]